jgi:hypothetical protein
MRLHLDIFAQQGLTPEDRLLHLDKHLRRQVLFEHVARETYPPIHPGCTPTTGSSRPAEESASAGSTTQPPGTSSPSTSGPRPRNRPTWSSSGCSRSGRTTCITTTTRT